MGPASHIRWTQYSQPIALKVKAKRAFTSALSRRWTGVSVCYAVTGPAQVYGVLPGSAGSGLAGDDQVEFRDKGDELPARAGLEAGAFGDAFAAAVAQERRDLPGVRVGLRPARFLFEAFDGM